MDNKNLFFGLGSILIIIMILSLLGILGPPEKEVILQESRGYNPPFFYKPPVSKTVVYRPEHYVRTNPYKSEYYN